LFKDGTEGPLLHRQPGGGTDAPDAQRQCGTPKNFHCSVGVEASGEELPTKAKNRRVAALSDAFGVGLV